MEGNKLKKRFLLLIGTVFITASLFGCSKISPTEEQNDMIAQYLAGIILRNEVNYTEKLVTPTPAPSPTLNPTVTEKPDNTDTNHTDSNKEDSNSQQTQPVLDFTQVIGIDGLKFSYEKYERINEIFDGIQNINSEDGKQLLIISFKIENTSTQPITINLGDKKINYELDLGQDKKLKPLLTFLEEDLRFLNTTIKAGESQTGVVLFSIDKDQKMDSVNVIISENSKTTTIVLK